MVSKGLKIATGKGLSTKLLNSYGLNVAENFLQEALIDPISEGTAFLVGGKESANFDNLFERSINSGIDGVISALLLSGSTIGLAKSANVVNKLNNNTEVSQTEIKEAIKEIQESGKVNVEEVIQGVTQGVLENEKTTQQNTNTQDIAPYEQIDNNIANNEQTLYNNNESESVINERENEIIKSNEQGGITGLLSSDNRGQTNDTRYQENLTREEYTQTESEQQIQQRGMLEGNNGLSGISEESSQQARRQYTKQEYEQWEKSIKPITYEQLTTEQKELKNIVKRQHNKDVVFFDGQNNVNGYSAGASYTDSNKINIDIKQAEEFGLNKLVYHETIESDILHNEEIRKDIIEPALKKIIEDPNFEQQKNIFWQNQEGQMPNDYLIAKEILCDRFAEMKTGEQWDYDNVLLQETNMTIDYAIENFEKQLNKTSLKEDIAPIAPNNELGENIAPVGEQQGEIGKKIDDENLNEEQERAAKIMKEIPTPKNKQQRLWAKFVLNFVDKASPFENLSIKTKNRELIAKWDYILTAEARAQNVMLNGTYEYDSTNKERTQVSKSLEDIRTEVGDDLQEFSQYLYHKLNIDRMTLDSRLGIDNKPVFGDTVTAEISQRIAEEYENNNPEFMDWAKDVYDYNKANLNQLVKSGVVSQETADYFEEVYPHYVPIARANVRGNAINVPLDTNRTGINVPIKKAKGGNQDILPLFDTMARRTLQTYKAVAKNNFGVELKNTLNSVVENQQTDVEEVLDNVDQQEELLKEGKKGREPTFTVFENGEKVTYEITKDMYDALKPISESSILNTTFKPFNAISNFQRGVLTEYNPVFMLTNAIKDVQDVILNSQHATKTYAKFGEAYTQIMKKGYWYKEYMANGGEQNSYFNSQDGTFDTNKKGILEVFPLRKISELNNLIEMAPRLAEYIASREAGRSIETSMLDAARITTNFKAGGDVTKWANRNGATFLNASVQGAFQQVRNVREANMNGLKGYANLATKFTLAGLPAIILNSLLWSDDEEYEELSDYVKTNYWVVGKYGDGNFIRIPKGRMITVIQESFNQMKHLITGDEQVDYGQFIEVLGNNLAPNNPIESNVLSPIIDAARNKTWYGGDLVPSRLQDVPAEEQYDESIDKLSIAIGQKTGISPYKINYVLDQYSGGIGDILLPMLTEQAEGGNDSLGSKLIAPLVDKFTVDSTMKNQNVSDLYTLSDEITIKANSSKATDEEVLQNKYLNAVKTEMNELYKQKREIQSDTTLSDSEKYNQVREIQEEINNMAKEATEKYKDVTVKSNYSLVGGKEYYKNSKDEWTSIREEEAEELKELGMTSTDKNTYFKTKNEISKIVSVTKDSKDQITIDDEDSEEYKKAVDLLNSEKKADIVNKIIDSGLNDNEKAYLYKKFYNSDTIDTMINANINVDDYLTYTTMEFKADYNSNGKAISNSRKNKVISYVNSLKGLNIPQKAILIKATNTFKFNDYNNDIIKYVKGLKIEYLEKVRILEDLDMTVAEDGKVTWKK